MNNAVVNPHVMATPVTLTKVDARPTPDRYNALFGPLGIRPTITVTSSVGSFGFL